MYHVIKRACVGYKKLKKGKGSQDALKAVQLKNASIVAVADGHGDPACTYSDRGAKFATEALVLVVRELLAKVPLKGLYAHVLQNREQIIKDIIKTWNNFVFNDYLQINEVFASSHLCENLKDYLDNLFVKNDGEINSKDAPNYFRQVSECEDALKKITRLYGTTLNGMLLTNNFVFCLGIGDGDLTFVQNGKVYWLLPPSEQFSTSTPSMCYKPQKAVEYFLSSLVRLDNKHSNQNGLFKTGIKPDYLLMATDGFRNSFVSDDHFVQKLVDIAKQKNSDFKSFKAHSNQWIKTLTAESLYQDDISLVLIYC